MAIIEHTTDGITVRGKDLCEEMATGLADAANRGNDKPVIVLDEALYMGMRAWLKEGQELVMLSSVALRGKGAPMTGATFNHRPVIVTFTAGLPCPMIL